MTPFQFTIISLAVWRLSALISYEDGPFQIFRKLRERVGIEHYDNGQQVEKEYKGLASLFGCVWCVSFWIGLWLFGLYCQRPLLVIMFSMPFALSAGAIIVERINNG